MMAPVMYAGPAGQKTATPAGVVRAADGPSGEDAAISSPSASSVAAIILDSNGPRQSALTVLHLGTRPLHGQDVW